MSTYLCTALVTELVLLQIHIQRSLQVGHLDDQDLLPALPLHRCPDIYPGLRERCDLVRIQIVNRAPDALLGPLLERTQSREQEHTLLQ